MDFDWQNAQDTINFEAAWATARSGKGSPYYSLPVFVNFAQYVHRRQGVVEYTDVYEHTSDGILPRHDLGMWCFPKAEWSWHEKYERHREELELFVATLNSEEKSFSVECWVVIEDDAND